LYPVLEMLKYDDKNFGRVRHIHCVGIGGSGMSGIAEVLLSLGYKVSGSDISVSKVTERLTSLGICINNMHSERNIEGADVIVYSSAVGESNLELEAARSRRVPAIPRAEMLAEIMRFRYGIAVAGTHGKTTTTSLIATLLADGGKDPTFIVGGLVRSANTNARLGSGDYLVAEADESDGSFLSLHPLMAVLTNIDRDHLCNYAGDFSVLKQGFTEFLKRLPFYGVAYLCADDAETMSLLPQITANVVTYGFNEEADYRASNLRHKKGKEYFDLKMPSREDTVNFSLNMSGEHNVQNAVAAIAVSSEVGLDCKVIMDSLERFGGIDRRFQVYENMSISSSVVTIVDDYSHHPTEIQAVIKTIRRRWLDNRLVIVFQPHRYTRTKELFEDFVSVLCESDMVVLFEVYGAGEEPIAGADGRSLTRSIRNRGKFDPVFKDNCFSLEDAVADVIENDDVIAVIGAGSIGYLVEELIAS